MNFKPLVITLMSGLMAGAALLAQTSTIAQKPPAQRPAAKAPEKSPESSPAPAGMTVDNVVAMINAGLSDDLIVARLRKENKAFDLSSDQLIRLKQAKVSDGVLKAMLDPRAEITPPLPVPAPTPAQIVVQTPTIPGLPVNHASGATPSPGAEATGDPNDPNAPHDSGIYLYTKDRDGKPQLVVLERAGYQGSKTGGVFVSAMTYGIKKAQNRAIIPGPKASIRVTDATATFYFYFDDKQAGLGKSMFGIGSLSNPNQFALLKLDVNKGNRETVIGQFGAFSQSSGTDAKAMIPFKSERIRPGFYKVVVEGLKLGEYCFLASSSNMAQMSGAAAAADIFDFGVNVE